MTIDIPCNHCTKDLGYSVEPRTNIEPYFQDASLMFFSQKNSSCSASFGVAHLSAKVPNARTNQKPQEDDVDKSWWHVEAAIYGRFQGTRLSSNHPSEANHIGIKCYKYLKLKGINMLYLCGW